MQPKKLISLVLTVPQIKKIVIIGESKGITLPKVWLDYNKKRYGREIREVLLEESNQSLIIRPIAPTTGKEGKHDS
jgi:hypothetical protein